MHYPEVSIIIVSYNHSEILHSTLTSIQKMIVNPEFEIIVVDNASTDENVLMIEKEFSEVFLIKSKYNLGFGRACNLGVKNARGRFLLFVNSDILLNGNPLPQMIEVFEELDNVGSLGVQLHNPDGTSQPSGFRFPGLFMRFMQLTGLKKLILKIKPAIRISNEHLYEVDFVSGAFLMLEKQLFDDVGGFDERYFMYLEDADLCYQLKQKGKINFILNRKDILHLNENHENPSNPFVFYHLNLGHLLFYQKNFSNFKTNLLKLLTRLVFNLRLIFLHFSGASDSEINKYKKVLTIFN